MPPALEDPPRHQPTCGGSPQLVRVAVTVRQSPFLHVGDPDHVVHDAGLGRGAEGQVDGAGGGVKPGRRCVDGGCADVAGGYGGAAAGWDRVVGDAFELGDGVGEDAESKEGEEGGD